MTENKNRDSAWLAARGDSFLAPKREKNSIPDCRHRVTLFAAGFFCLGAPLALVALSSSHPLPLPTPSYFEMSVLFSRSAHALLHSFRIHVCAHESTTPPFRVYKNALCNILLLPPLL